MGRLRPGSGCIRTTGLANEAFAARFELHSDDRAGEWGVCGVERGDRPPAAASVARIFGTYEISQALSDAAARFSTQILRFPKICSAADVILRISLVECLTNS